MNQWGRKKRMIKYARECMGVRCRRSFTSLPTGSSDAAITPEFTKFCVSLCVCVLVCAFVRENVLRFCGAGNAEARWLLHSIPVPNREEKWGLWRWRTDGALWLETSRVQIANRQNNKKTGTARVRWKTEAVEQEVRWRVCVWWKTGGIKTVVVTRGAISLTSLPPSWNAYCCCFIKLIGVIVFGAWGLIGCVGFVFTSHCFWEKECAYSLDCCGVAGVLRVLIDGWWFSNLTICLSVRLAPPFFEQ